MKTCSCGNNVNPNDLPLGELEGLEYFNCPKCQSTLIIKTEEYPKLLATRKALKLAISIEELEDYIKAESAKAELAKAE